MNNQIISLLTEIKTHLKGKSSKEWFTINELSTYTSLSPSTIRRAIQRGELKASKKTGKLLFKISDVERWLNG